MDQPSPPDPTATANAQAQYNTKAATTQAELNQVGQQTPFGSLTYTQTGTAPDGTPQFTAKTALDPTIQALLNTQLGTQQGIGTAANQLIGNLGPALTSAPKLDTSTLTNDATRAMTQYMTPYFTQQNSNLEGELAAKGVMPGSAAYDNAKRTLEQGQQSTIANTAMQFEPQAFSQAVQSYQLPIQTLGTLLGESAAPSATSSFLPTPQEQIAAPNYAGLQEQNYQQANQIYANTMNGLFGMGSAVLGGLARGGIPMMPGAGGG